jgi:hypothetical protein
MAKRPTKSEPKPEGPLEAASVHTLPPGEAERQAAMYEAAERGDTAEFERLRDGG